MKPSSKNLPSRVRPSLAALLAALAFGHSAVAQTISNPSFEADTYTVFPGYSSDHASVITDWTSTNYASVGLNPSSGIPFADNGAIPDGLNAAFLQSAGSNLSTTITGLTPGVTYKVSFRANARAGNQPIVQFSSDGIGDTVVNSLFAVGGANPYHRLAYNFTATGTSNVITVTNLQAPDNTLVVDDFSVVPSTTWSFSPWTDDASSGVLQGYCYTHAYTLGGSCVPTVVNGVGFLAAPGGNPSVAGKFSTSGLPNGFGDQGRNITGASNSLGKSFIYGGPNMSITLKNLKPLTAYVATVYGVNFDGPGGDRTSSFSSSLDPTDVLTVNVDQYGANNGIRVNYAYTTDATGTVTITYDQFWNASWHTSAFSNREAAPESSWTRSPWNNDATSGVDGAPADYTHAYMFGGAAAFSANINGITFIGVGGANPSAPGIFSTSGLDGAFGADTSNVTASGGGSASLAGSFVFGADPLLLNLAGLTPGAAYKLTIFSVGWENADGVRGQTFSGDEGYMHSDQDSYGDNNGIRFEYRYHADAAGNAQVRVMPTITGNSLHTYGFCNRSIDSAPTPTLAWKISQWSNDATSGVDGAATYTHAYNFGSGTNAIVNGITFTAISGVNPAASNFTTAGLDQGPVGDGNALTGNGDGSAILANSFVYNGNPATFKLTGLNPGDSYRLTLFSVAWDPAGRWQTFSGSNGRIIADQDAFGSDQGFRAEYDYRADGAGQATIVVDPSAAGGSFHTYAFCNRLLAPLANLPAWTASAWDGDASSGFTTAGLYTHAYNLGSSTSLIINGVGVTGVGGANPGAANFSTQNFNAQFTGFGNFVGNPGTSNTMAADFVYNGFPGGLRLTGLTAGKEYLLSLYLVGFASPGQRFVNFSGDNDCFLVDQNAYNSGNGMRVDYRYIANSDGTANITTSPQTSGSLHLSGFANREAALLPVSPPIITLEPVGGSEGTGRSFTFSVGATGTPTLTYQWKFNGTDIPLATSATYTRSGLTLADTGDYSVVVTNFFGDDTSVNATLTVHDSINGLFDTGVSQNCVLAAYSGPDPHYQLIVNADGGAVIPAVVHDSTIFPVVAGPWIANTATSKWIAPRANSAGSAGLWLVVPGIDSVPPEGIPNDQGAGPGTYVYRTTVDLTGFDPATVVIKGTWTSDNNGPNIRVNGVDTGITGDGNFGSLAPFTLTSSNSTFVAGVNTIDFLVTNADALGGYTALRVADLHGFGDIAAGTAPHIAVQPVGITVARNATFCLSVAANGSSALSYQWFKDTVLLPGETSSTLISTADAFTKAGAYTVRVSNGTGNVTSNDAIVTIPNQAPVAGVDTMVTRYSTAAFPFAGAIDLATVLANDSDGDSDTLTLTVDTPTPEGGATEFLDPSIFYLPPNDFSGTDTITYTIDDGWGGVATGTITVTVIRVDCGEIILDQDNPQTFSVGVLPGVSYIFQRSINLIDWDDLETLVGPPSGVLDVVDPDPLVEIRFYRFKKL